MPKIIIHRGTHQIGGSCVEIATDRSRIFLDIGLPLNEQDKSEQLTPNIEGLFSSNDYDPSIAGVLLSHSHLDHYGLSDNIHKDVPIYASEATEKLINLSAVFNPFANHIRKCSNFNHNEPFRCGEFLVTPLLVDHSAFDSYMFLIEAEGKRILYSGDFRTHGNKPYSVKRIMDMLAGTVDLLILEGTTMSRMNTIEKSERDLQVAFHNIIAKTKSITLVTLSSQNIDRLVTLYKVSRMTRRLFVIDFYTANILSVLKDYAQLPYPSPQYDNIYVYFPQSLSSRIVKQGDEKLLYRFSKYKITKKEISDKPEKVIMTVRSSAISFLNEIKGLEGGNFIYSMWEGYKKTASMKRLINFAKKSKMKQMSIHSSGHADRKALDQFVMSIKPNTIIPIHTETPSKYKDIWENVEVPNDGEVYSLG